MVYSMLTRGRECSLGPAHKFLITCKAPGHPCLQILDDALQGVAFLDRAGVVPARQQGRRFFRRNTSTLAAISCQRSSFWRICRSGEEKSFSRSKVSPFSVVYRIVAF